MRRALTMRIDLDVIDKDKYEQIQRECERFKDKLMSEMEDYDFGCGERIGVDIYTVKDSGDMQYGRL